MHCFIFGRLLSPAVEFPHTGEVAHSRSPDYHILGQPNHLVGSGISLLSLSIIIRLSCPPSTEPSFCWKFLGISLIINIFLFGSITALIMNYQSIQVPYSRLNPIPLSVRSKHPPYNFLISYRRKKRHLTFASITTILDHDDDAKSDPDDNVKGLWKH